jgi:hypothetical protein
MNIRVGLATPEGQLKSITFSKAGKKQMSGEKPSLHMQLFGLSGGNMNGLIGKTIHIWTWDADPETGVAWGQGNPRKFGVELVPDTTYELGVPLPDEFKVPALYANDGVAGGQPAAPQQQQPPMQGGFYTAPTAQPQMQQPYPYGMQQPAQFQPQQPQPMMQQQPLMQQQPMMQQPAPRPMMQPPMVPPMPAVQAMPPQPMGAPMPQGMDPAVAQAMQAMGVTNVQPVSGAAIYDDELPFD